MKFLSGFVVLLFIDFLTAAPASDKPKENNTIYITKELYPQEYIVYKGNHEIVNLLVPLNFINFEDSDSSESNSKETDEHAILFFVEADITAEGKRIDKGLYILEKGKAKKLLDHGRDAAASGDNSKKAFFGANDGIYVYEDGKTEKYGTLTDSIVAIVVGKLNDVMYILTEDYQVYNVTENGNKKQKIDDIVNAQQIVLDYSNNLYFYSKDKIGKVLTNEGVKIIEGLPENPSSVTLIKPPFVIQDGVLFIIDNNIYGIYANGSSEVINIKFKPHYKPTAYAAEAALLQYYAYDKKIYEYNIVVMLLKTVLKELKSFLSEQTAIIQRLATKSKA